MWGCGDTLHCPQTLFISADTLKGGESAIDKELDAILFTSFPFHFHDVGAYLCAVLLRWREPSEGDKRKDLFQRKVLRLKKENKLKFHSRLSTSPFAYSFAV